MTHLLVTNDYPPKLGGIQTYLYELWSRIPSERFVVLTSRFPGAENFDATAPHRIVRVDRNLLVPSPAIIHHIRELATEIDAKLVVFDPLFPLGCVAPFVKMPYAVVLHGAEVTIPGRFPPVRQIMQKVLRDAHGIIAAGEYPARAARLIVGHELVKTVVVPPGVDGARFRPLESDERIAVREKLGVAPEARLVLSVSRLVPRKGMDVLIEAAGRLAPTRADLRVLIGGSGRDEHRLRTLIGEHSAPVELIGRVSDDDLPYLYGAADVFAMLARDRWLGLEQEGFGIVYLEAAAAGVAQLAGRSGGTIDAVEDEVTGLVVDRPGDVAVATAALGRLLDDGSLRSRLGGAARARAMQAFDYDVLGARLDEALREFGG